MKFMWYIRTREPPSFKPPRCRNGVGLPPCFLRLIKKFVNFTLKLNAMSKPTTSPAVAEATYDDIIVLSLGTRYVPSLDKTKLHFKLNGELKTAWSRQGDNISVPSGVETVVTVVSKADKTYYNV